MSNSTGQKPLVVSEYGFGGGCSGDYKTPCPNSAQAVKYPFFGIGTSHTSYVLSHLHLFALSLINQESKINLFVPMCKAMYVRNIT